MHTMLVLTMKEFFHERHTSVWSYFTWELVLGLGSCCDFVTMYIHNCTNP